jgi:hypothetical protein
LRASAPVPSPSPRALLSASPPKGLVEVEAPSPELEESGTWEPATGGSITLCFLHPGSKAAPAMSKAIESIRFIYSSVLVISDCS